MQISSPILTSCLPCNLSNMSNYTMGEVIKPVNSLSSDVQFVIFSHRKRRYELFKWKLLEIVINIKRMLRWKKIFELICGHYYLIFTIFEIKLYMVNQNIDFETLIF